jgi:hypothetical protein
MTKDFGAGLLFAALGLLLIALSSAYTIGTLAQMGPGFVPLALGIVMASLGAIQAFKGRGGAGEHVLRLPVAPFLWIAVGIAGFALTVERAGYVPAAAILLGASILASRKPISKSVLLVSAAIVILSGVVFLRLLGLPVAWIVL